MTRIGEPAGSRGFTLLELLVVVSIVSVLTTVAGLSVTLNRPAPDNDPARFSAIYDRARHLAVAEGRIVGLRLTGAGAQIMRREANGWVADGDAIAWDGAARIDGARLIVLWPSDQADPVLLEFPGNGGPTIRCAAPGTGRMRCAG